MTEPSHELTLQLVQERLKKRGDMPIFSSSLNRIQAVGADPDADAMALSMEILKDANLTTKVLRMANSPLYNRGQGKIGQLSRAIVVLGFETVRSAVLTLKLVDSFQQENKGIDMTPMLVNSYLAGVYVRGLSVKCGMRDIEQVYICGLLHNLGEIIVAFTLPDEFKKIRALQEEKHLTLVAAERQVLGTNFRSLGQDVARDWGFPTAVVSSMEDYTSSRGRRVHIQGDLTGVLSSLAHKTISLIFAGRPVNNQTLSDLKHEVAAAASIKNEDVMVTLEQSFKESCELAEDFGLDKKLFMPRLRSDEDEELEKLSREFSYYANSEIKIPPATTSVQKKSKLKPKSKSAIEPEPKNEASLAKAVFGGDKDVFVDILSELTTLMSQMANFNSILEKVLEGICRGVGFDRAVLCLLSPDHKYYIGRLAAGKEAVGLKEYFNFPVNVKEDIFSKLLIEGDELLINDINQGWQQQLPDDFEAVTGARGFILGTLRSRARPLGIFYADKALSGGLISGEEQRMFKQLVAQAQLALRVR